MTTVGFIGLGHMGNPMAQNLIAKGFSVHVFDLNAESVKDCVAAGAKACTSAVEAAEGRDVVITMLPAGQHVRSVYMGETGLLESIHKPTLFIDCSTIDIETSHDVHVHAMDLGHRLLDAPVSGGVTGAQKGALTFMVGGEATDFEEALPLFQAMGKNIFHAGEATHGQAAKVCNNLMLGIHMIGTSEAFNLAEKLGLAKERLFEISSVSSGQSWTLVNYCPAPGLVESSPANRNYVPGFTADMMLKDLNLAIEAAHHEDLALPLTEKAGRLYEEFCKTNGKMDFSGIIQFLR